MRNLDSRVEQSLIPIVARWAEQDKAMLLPLFRLIDSGEQLKESQLTKELDIAADAIGATLKTSLAEIDSSGRVSELFGVTRETTLHRIDVGGEILFSCCALVAHMVPAILQQAAIIESTDPISGNTITVKISAEAGLQHVDPVTACGSMVDCADDKIISSPRTSFCCHVRHFDTTDSAEKFAGQRPNLYVMTIEDFHEAAQWLHEQIWET